MLKRSKRYLAAMLTGAMLLTNVAGTVKVSAETITTDVKDYEIYPVPQSTKYENGSFNIGTDVNVIYEDGIDIYTQNRLDDILKSHNINYAVSEDVVSGKTNILVGINGSGEEVDTYFNENVSHDEEFFNKRDSHLVYSKNGIIGVLGNNTDSAFYGVTTLKHVFNQLDNKEIRNFKIDDYSDVAYRGFIEGYYGNPWSNEDRAELMKYGGDYKLNQYIFAPKDDPYHNSKWRELYPAEKLEGIRNLAKVGNETKNRYVYALHPFMYNAIRFDNDANYQGDLTIIKNKFTQLLEVGVRQFGILADDAGVPAQGPSSYVKLLNDLTVWLEEQKKTYTDLKTDLVFCPNDYMGNGSSAQLKEINKAGSNVSIVMTGGRIWGEVDQTFATNFINNIATEGNPGRAPYFWINWPCSDNSKQHLIMGGNDTFLHPGVDPNTIKGIVLNPMQQAEANKSALFAVSDYSWNIWGSKADADKNWNDSFKYMDHGTAKETESSKALRELSKHMINQNMDSRVRVLQESLELAPKLNDFKAKYESGADVKEDAEKLIQEFTNLKNSAEYYKNSPGNERTRDQIIYWLNCWEDTTNAVINYLNAVIANEEGDNNKLWMHYSEAQAAFEKSKTYGFHYVDHYEYAEVGVQHIVPFIKYLGQSLSGIVEGLVDPSKVLTTYITNRTDTPTGNLANVLDNNPATEIVYKTPNTVVAGTYVGVKYNKAIKVKEVEFILGAIANPNDTMQEAKLQYTEDGKTWVDLNDKLYTMPGKIEVTGLDINAMGIRLIATKDRANTWLGIKDITINKSDMGKENNDTAINATVIRTSAWGIYSGTEANLLDGRDNTDVWYKTNTGDITKVGDFIGLNLGSIVPVGKVRFVLGRSGSADKWTNYKLEYSTDNTNWTTYKEYVGKASGQDIIEEDFEGIEARYVRITNTKQLNKWIIVSDLKVEKATSLPSTRNIYTNTNLDIKSIYASEELTKLVPKNDITLKANDYIGIKLNRIKDLKEIVLEVSNMDGLKLQTSMNEAEWFDVENKNELKDGRYVRLIANKDVTFNLTSLEVKSNEVYEPTLKSAYTSDLSASAKVAFDRNFNSSVNFKAAPRKDQSIVYDLGQNISINNLKYVVLDTEINHIRDAKIQLSLDGQTWTDAITIGDGIQNDSTDMNLKPVDNGYKHGNQSGGIIPISHAYMDSGDINVEARYLRVYFTANYDHRWTMINELLINNGEYIKTVNDPTYVSNPIELDGFGPGNIKDGNLTTAYRPNTKNGEIKEGSLTYRLSEKTNVKKINIVQSGNVISNAKVMARTGYTEAGEEVWNQIGTLSKSLNEIVNTKYDNIYEIKIEWQGVAPTIYEIVTINDYDVPNITELEDLVASCNYVEKDYTANSWNVYSKALEAAKAILNDLASFNQGKIDKAREDLVNSVTGLVNIVELSTIINDDVKYTEATLNNLINMVEVAEVVLNNPEATSEMVNKAVEDVREAINGLVEEDVTPVIKKHLQVLVEEADTITEEELSKVTDKTLVDEFKAALEEAKAVLSDEKATQEIVEKSFDRLSKAMGNLSFENVDKQNLISLVERIGKLNSDDYILGTWKNLQDELVKANILISNEKATQEEVVKGYEALLKAFLDLRLKPSKDRLEDLINKAIALDSNKYTKETWSNLVSILNLANSLLENDNATETQILDAEYKLQKAIYGLLVKADDNNNGNNGNNNGNGGNSNNNGNNGGNSNNNNNGSNNVNNNNNNKLPITGGTSSVAIILIGLFTLCLGIILKTKKQKVQ